MTNPTEIFFFFLVGLEKFAGAPITPWKKMLLYPIEEGSDEASRA
jgi:hypothetical protein